MFFRKFRRSVKKIFDPSIKKEIVKEYQKVLYPERMYQEHFLNIPDKKETVIEADDELLWEAVRIIIDYGSASASILQRRLKIGYTRAARLIDLMEGKGMIGPYEGSKPREVYITARQLEEIKKHQQEQ